MKQIASFLVHYYKQSKWLGIMVKAGLTLLGFWLACHDIDFSHMKVIIQGQNHAMLAVVVALLALQIMFGALRWRLIMQALAGVDHHEVTSWQSLRIYYISVFFNSCLPGTVGGDVVRIWLARAQRVSLALAVNSVIIDRVLALIALALIVVVMLPLLGTVGGFDALKVMPPLLVAVVLGLWCMTRLERWLAPVRHWRPVHWLLYFVNSIRLMFTHFGTSCLSLAYAVVAHIAYCLAAYMMARSLAIPLSFLHCLTLIPLVVLTTVLPISIGGWGVREASMIGLLGMVGVSKAGALMLSVQLGLIGMFITLPGGLMWLACRQHASLQQVGNMHER